MAKLTPLQAAFVRKYVANPTDGAAAYIAAGGSKRRAKQGASEMLKVPAVAEAIKEFQEKANEKTLDDIEISKRELRRIVQGDLRKVMSWGPDGVTVRPSTDLADEEAAMVAEVSETITKHGRTIKLKLHDKPGAIDKLMRIVGGYAPEKSELTGPNGLPLAPPTINVNFIEPKDTNG